MKIFRIIKLSKKVIIFQLRVSKHKLLELQLEFNIWDIIKNITKSISNLFRIVIPSTNNLGESLANVAKNIEWFTGLLAGKNKIKNQFSFLGVLAAISEKTYSVIKRLFNIARKLWDQGLKPIFAALGQFVFGLGPQVWGIIDKLVGKLEAFSDMLINSGLFSSIANIFTGTSSAILQTIHIIRLLLARI